MVHAITPSENKPIPTADEWVDAFTAKLNAILISHDFGGSDGLKWLVPFPMRHFGVEAAVRERFTNAGWLVRSQSINEVDYLVFRKP